MEIFKFEYTWEVNFSEKLICAQTVKKGREREQS